MKPPRRSASDPWLPFAPLAGEGNDAVASSRESSRSEKQGQYVRCPVLVLRVNESQVTSDTVADALCDEMLSLYQQSEAVHMVLDMEQVVYLSSAGIRLLLAVRHEVRKREGRLVLCNLKEVVEEVLVVTRLVSASRATPATFEKQADVPSAVAGLYQPAP